MPEEHTPTEAGVRLAYVGDLKESGEQGAELRAQFDRFIARIKAEALREAAEALDMTYFGTVELVGTEGTWVDLPVDEWLGIRANQIENGETSG